LHVGDLVTIGIDITRSASKIFSPLRYALMPFAATCPRPIASTTDDGPVSTSPAAKTPFTFVHPLLLISTVPLLSVILTFPTLPTSGFAPTAGMIISAFITNSLSFMAIGL